MPRSRTARSSGQSDPSAPAESSGGDDTMTCSLIRSLEASERFRRDGRLGGIFHPGRVSYRELSPRDSLHIIVDGNRVSAHVDEVCPLRRGRGGVVRYSWLRVVAHNLSGAVADIGRRLHGVHGEQRCNLGCEVVWVDDQISGFAADLEATSSSAPGARPEGSA